LSNELDEQKTHTHTHRYTYKHNECKALSVKYIRITNDIPPA